MAINGGSARDVPAPPSARGAEKENRRNLKPVGFRLGTVWSESEGAGHPGTSSRRGTEAAEIHASRGSEQN